MNKAEVLKSVIKAISIIENNPKRNLIDYSIYDALCKTRDYLMQKNLQKERSDKI